MLKNKADIIFDVGANRGDITLKYLTLFPNARIHSFEPFPESYEIFIARHKDNLNVQLNKYALSSFTFSCFNLPESYWDNKIKGND